MYLSCKPCDPSTYNFLTHSRSSHIHFALQKIKSKICLHFFKHKEEIKEIKSWPKAPCPDNYYWPIWIIYKVKKSKVKQKCLKESAAISPSGPHPISPKVITANSLFSDSFPKTIICVRAPVNTQGLISYITGYKQKAAEVSKVRSADSQHKAQLLQKYPVYLIIIIDSSRRCDLAGLCRPRNLHFIKHLPWSSSEAEGSLLLKDLLKFNVVQILLPISPHIVLVKPLANCGYSNMALVCCHVQPLTSLAYFSLIPFFFFSTASCSKYSTILAGFIASFYLTWLLTTDNSILSLSALNSSIYVQLKLSRYSYGHPHSGFFICTDPCDVRISVFVLHK